MVLDVSRRRVLVLLLSLVALVLAPAGPLATLPAQATPETTVSVSLSQQRISTVAGMPHGTRVTVRSSGPRVSGTVIVRRAGGRTVKAWDVDDTRRFSARWDGTGRTGRYVAPGRYRVIATVHRADDPSQRQRAARTVRVLKRGQGWTTPLGFVRAVPITQPIHRFHIEVHEQANQVLVVNQRNKVVRRIPVGGNPAIAKPRLSYVGDRTPMSYDYAWTKRLPWFVRLVHGRGIGTHTIPRYISTGKPTIPVSALGRRPGGPAPVSAGCLRMHDLNAKWFYDRVPAGTPVYWI